jgi:oligosaccharyltransferase complex subunit beta
LSFAAESLPDLSTMRSLVTLVVLLLAAAVQAISSAGDRLLVILDDVADKSSYSKFLGDLKGAC